MDPHHFADIVANFMRELFRYKLRMGTSHKQPPKTPETPSCIPKSLAIACDKIVNDLVEAFIHIRRSLKQ